MNLLNEIKVRAAGLSDLLDVFEWRNDIVTRSMSRNSDAIRLAKHCEWYQIRLAHPTTSIYIGVLNDKKIGVVDFKPNSATNLTEVSINLNPIFRGQGYGAKFLLLCIENYDFSGELHLTATIKRENLASLRVFSVCGFHKYGESEFFYYLRRP